MIPGIGENRIDRDLTGDAMIPVPDISTVGIGGDNRLRPVKTNHAHNLFSKFRCIFKSLIRILQKYHLTHSQNFSSGPLLTLPDFGQLIWLYIRVAGSFVSVGANYIYNLFSLLCPSSYRSGNPEFSIIRVGSYHKYIRWFRHLNPPCSIYRLNEIFNKQLQKFWDTFKLLPRSSRRTQSKELKNFCINLRAPHARHRKPLRRGGRVCVLCGD
jgi:hypothetical protein